MRLTNYERNEIVRRVISLCDFKKRHEEINKDLMSFSDGLYTLMYNAEDIAYMRQRPDWFVSLDSFRVRFRFKSGSSQCFNAQMTEARLQCFKRSRMNQIQLEVNHETHQPYIDAHCLLLDRASRIAKDQSELSGQLRLNLAAVNTWKQFAEQLPDVYSKVKYLEPPKKKAPCTALAAPAQVQALSNMLREFGAEVVENG